jgi:hypothetical protein
MHANLAVKEVVIPHRSTTSDLSHGLYMLVYSYSYLVYDMNPQAVYHLRSSSSCNTTSFTNLSSYATSISRTATLMDDFYGQAYIQTMGGAT